MPPKNAQLPSPARRAAREVNLGFALGIAALLLGVPLAGRVLDSAEGLITSLPGAVGFALVILLRELPALAVAPGIAWAAGLYLEVPRWRVAVPQQLALLVCWVAMSAVTLGSEAFSVGEITIRVLTVAAGVALSGLAMGRSQRQARAREQARVAQASAVPPPLSAIDFEAVKRAQDDAARAAAPADDKEEKGKDGPGSGPV